MPVLERPVPAIGEAAKCRREDPIAPTGIGHCNAVPPPSRAVYLNAKVLILDEPTAAT